MFPKKNYYQVKKNILLHAKLRAEKRSLEINSNVLKKKSKQSIIYQETVPPESNLDTASSSDLGLIEITKHGHFKKNLKSIENTDTRAEQLFDSEHNLAHSPSKETSVHNFDDKHMFDRVQVIDLEHMATESNLVGETNSRSTSSSDRGSIPSSKCNSEMTENYESNTDKSNTDKFHSDRSCSDEELTVNALDSEQDHDSENLRRTIDKSLPLENEMFDGSETEPCKEFKSDISLWIRRCNVPHTTANDLLKIINAYHPEDKFPHDVRSLLGTRRNVSHQIEKIGSGHFHYFGVTSGLNEVFKYVSDADGDTSTLKLTLSVDGIPLSRSGKISFWPVLGCVDVSEKIFVVAIYCGPDKPEINSYLRPLVTELKELHSCGFTTSGRRYKIDMDKIVADAPARAFLKQIKGHTGYYACERCCTRGEYRKGISFSSICAPERTDESFKKMEQPEHHIGLSPLIEINFPMVSRFVLDWMHLVLLGIMRRLLNLWCNEVPHKVSQQSKSSMNDKLMMLRKWTPSEFQRKPRSFSDLERWKAVECRLFLLYTGSTILEMHLSNDQFKHFLLLFYAMRIFCDKDSHTDEMIDYGHKLCVKFVKNYPQIYKGKNTVYNIHSLIHLSQDVKKFGPLDDFSAFKFENALGLLKRKVHGGNLPLHQVCGRLSESSQIIEALRKKEKNKNSLLRRNCTIIPSVVKDACVQLTDKSLCIVKNIDGPSAEVQKLEIINSRFSYPCDSELLQIFKTKMVESKIIHTHSIEKKCFIIPEQNYYTVIPML